MFFVYILQCQDGSYYTGHTDNLENRLYQYQNKIRLLSKLAAESKVRGESERRTGVYTSVHDDSSTGSTKQFAAAVEFGKKSIIPNLLYQYSVAYKIDALRSL